MGSWKEEEKIVCVGWMRKNTFEWVLLEWMLVWGRMIAEYTCLTKTNFSLKKANVKQETADVKFFFNTKFKFPFMARNLGEKIKELAIQRWLFDGQIKISIFFSTKLSNH